MSIEADLYALIPQIVDDEGISSLLVQQHKQELEAVIKWGSIKGTITDQEDLINLLKDLENNLKTNLESIFHYKGTVANEAALPEGAEIGDVYNVEDTGANFAYDGKGWDKLSETIDLSIYATKEELEAHKKEAEKAHETFALKADLEKHEADAKEEHAKFATKEEVAKAEEIAEAIGDKDHAVKYADFTYTNAEGDTATRKTIQLANYDSISGVLTDGQNAANLIMVSKWDVADIGSSQIHMNLNTKDTVTINDKDAIALQKDLDKAEDEIAELRAANESLLSRLAILEDKVSNLDKTDIQEVNVAEAKEATTLNEEKDYVIKGDIAQNLTVNNAKSIKIADVNVAGEEA